LSALSKNLENLKITLDYTGWEKEKLEATKVINNTQYSFEAVGWIPSSNIKKVEEDLEKETNQYAINELPLEEGEVPPVIIKNNNFMSPFEAVTKVYGLPKYSELDPTPFLSAYFIVFFALCLTDAGYGIIIFITMWLMNKKLKLAEGVKKLVKVLMYGGIVTFVIGTLFGGWFGLTPDQVPEALTYTTAGGDKLFIFQTINSIKNPITVLILALTMGFIQILMGVIMKLVHGIKYKDKKQAILDSGPWVFMLSAIGFYVIVAAGLLPIGLIPVAKWMLIIAALALVFTQGRDKKNIIGKFLSGILSLYGLVGYLSDVLSYSRILALGLATAIIGLAVNTVVGLVSGFPYIGWLFAIIVFVGGHTFNLLINSLGSFIHSGRLQFVEFFTKFMEGGGREFKPFSKKCKYLFIK
jgi:V/A-type H+-transporting ATPase subunit I